MRGMFRNMAVTVSLEQFVQAGHRLPPPEAARAVADAMQDKGAEVYMYCSPQCVRVCGRRVELKKKNGANFHAPGFTAPETYYGVQSEQGGVYFFGAVLYALTEGAVPPDVPARMNGAPLALGEHNPLRFFIENAMQMQAGRRTQSLARFGAELSALAAHLEAVQGKPQAAGPAMVQPHAVVPVAGRKTALTDVLQKIISAKKNLHRQPAAAVAQAKGQTAPPAPQKPKRRLRKRVIVAAVVPVVLVVLAGFGIYTWRQAVTLKAAISYGQYDQAQVVYRQAPWLRMQDEQLAAYVDAQVLMAQGELEQARQAFLALEDYRDSSELEQKLERYLHAESLPAGYSRYKTFYDLGDFLDAQEKALACLPEVYDEAIDRYEAGNYTGTAEYFEVLTQYPGYEDAELYKTACEVYEEIANLPGQTAYPAEISNTLRSLEQSIDIKGIALSNIDAFMISDWYASSGYYILVTEENYDTNLDIPLKTYRFTEKGMQGADDGQYYVKWEYVNFDTIYITMNNFGGYYYRAV